LRKVRFSVFAQGRPTDEIRSWLDLSVSMRPLPQCGLNVPICRRPRRRIWPVALQARPRSADRTRSPAAISQKTGVFQMSAGDYWLFRSENAQNRSPETDGQFAKARHWRAFLRVSGTVSPSAGLPGWGGRNRTSIWRFRKQMLLPVREDLQNPIHQNS
jgi:hypothetical protein